MSRGWTVVALALVFGGLCLGVTACGGAEATKTVSQPRGSLRVLKGQKLVTSFPVNPGVGYEWLVARPASSAPLRYLGSKATGPARPGAGGEVTYSFKAQAAGRARLVFLHAFRGRQLERRIVAVEVR